MNEKLEEVWLTFDDRSDRMKLYIGHEQKIAAHALHPEQWPHPRGGTKP